MRENFTFGNYNLECTKSYKYLGFDFTNSGSFSPAKENLRLKALKASFKLKSMIQEGNLSPKTAISLFNSLVRPIALYGSAIWGTSLLSNSLQSTLKKCDSLPAEKILLSFARFTLGVHKNTTTAAIREELGLYPLAIPTIKSKLKFRERIQKEPNQSLIGMVLRKPNGETNRDLLWMNSVSAKMNLLSSTNHKTKHLLNLLKLKYKYEWEIGRAHV